MGGQRWKSELVLPDSLKRYQANLPWRRPQVVDSTASRIHSREGQVREFVQADARSLYHGAGCHQFSNAPVNQHLRTGCPDSREESTMIEEVIHRGRAVLESAQLLFRPEMDGRVNEPCSSVDRISNTMEQFLTYVS